MHIGVQVIGNRLKFDVIARCLLPVAKGVLFMQKGENYGL